MWTPSRVRSSFWACCVCLLSPSLACADDVAALRAELDALKSDYTNRVATLEARITQLEAQAANPAPTVAGAAPAPAPVAPSGAGSQTAFNPSISVIIAGNYTDTSVAPDSYRIAGFIPSGANIGPGTRSFNLGESELTFAANVDPYFFANVTASITSEDTIGVEEAFFRTTALPSGFSVKGGRFFSSVGYLNEIHAHAWDFIDQPLIYQAFLDNQFSQDGVQAKWVAPTDTFIELGAETGNGGRFPGTRLARNGINGGALLVHVGHDLGESASFRAGVSWLDLNSENRIYADFDAVGAPVRDAFTGSSRTWIADATFKWSPHGNATDHALKVQGEYMRRTEAGQLAFGIDASNFTGAYRSQASGWYLQSVYQFLPRWRVGARYDELESNSPNIGLVDQGVLTAASFPQLFAHSPRRVSFMLDWNPSEFTRIRAQYAWDEARASEHDRQLFLQYLFAIGAHGAHKF
jgi:hypothetical protein